MRIERIRINGIKEPLGYRLDKVNVSFRVRETISKRAKSIDIAVAKRDEPDEIIARVSGEKLDLSGQVIDISLSPRTAYVVRIKVEGDKGDGAEAESFFETGKMDEEWRACWIASEKGDNCHPLFRKKFTVGSGFKKARLYASGVGMFEVYINGARLGDEYLKPGITNYEMRIQTITFEADGLKEGENELCFLLGKGWYMGTFGLENTEDNFGSRMAVIGELHLSYEDGSEEVLCTDASFEYSPSDIVESGIYFGETIDRTLHENVRWEPVSVIEDPASGAGTSNLIKSRLTDRLSLPVEVMEVLPVKEVLVTPNNETVLDFGQNFAGIPEFEADLPYGTRIVLDFGEILQQGNFYRGNYREANSQFVYVSKGEKETVRPHFTFFGFRYVKVTGWTGELKAESFRGLSLYSKMDRTGFIKTSNPKINRLYENTLWGLKSNFIDMPTDCPQRNERLGWTGDAQIFAPTASYHMDTLAFFHKFEQDLMDEQGLLDGAVPNYVPNIGHKKDAASAWGDIATFLPMTVWDYYGRRDELEFAYPMMKGWVDYMDRLDASSGERSYTFEPGFQFGDWLGLDGVSETSFKGGTDDGYLGCVYYYRSACLTAEAAKILDKSDDGTRYGELAEHIREHILSEYFTPSGRLAMDTQASYVVALKFGLYRDREKLIYQFKERLKKDGYNIKCGFVGAPILCTVLAECGLYSLAYDFLMKESFPGWLYCVNLGATTIWERWNSVGPDGTISNTGMNSLNHYAYGSVMEFMYGYAAGIRMREPGFKSAVIAPHPDYRLPEIQCSYDSASGRYVCNTCIRKDGRVAVHVEIPFGCKAEIQLPGSGEEPEVYDAGSYDFSYMPQRDYRRPYDEHTQLSALKHDERALQILFELVPPIGGMAKEGNREFENNELCEFRHMGFLPFEEKKLEEAIRRISELYVDI